MLVAKIGGTQMVQIAICDDEPEIIPQIEKTVNHFFRTHCIDCCIKSYLSSDNLQYDLLDGLYYDLFLLDIEMPGIDGMTLAKEIFDTAPAAKIIFITSHLEYAITAYEYSVFRYIPKTMIAEKLTIALEDFYKLYRLEQSEFYTIEIKNHVEQIPYRNILYILKSGKYAVFYLQDGRTQPVRKTLSQISTEINQEYFYFADRGCIVNLANVIGIDEAGVLFQNQQHVTISKAAMSEFKSILLRFWEKQI